MSEDNTQPPMINPAEMPGYAEWQARISDENAARLGNMAGMSVIENVPFDVPDTQVKPYETRYIIKSVPTPEELRPDYLGENGEFTDFNRLRAVIEKTDPDHKLADRAFRKNMLLGMDVTAAERLLTTIHDALEPTSKHSFADREVILSSGTGDDKFVGTIGIGSEDRTEVFASLLENVKLLAAKDDLESAGLLFAQGLVIMQPFEDGNKRTARAAFELITYGYDGSHYDISAMRDRLAFTHEARNSIYYVGMTSSPRESYELSTIPQEDKELFLRFNNQSNELMARPILDEALSHLGDKDIIEPVIGVMQQTTFGPNYVFRGSDKEDMRSYLDTFDISIFHKVVKDFCAGLTPDSALALITEDKNHRREFMKAIFASSSGVSPLPDYDYRGQARSDSTATLVYG